MKNNLKLFLIIFVSLSVTRFIPHPPNFTSLIALSFYVPALLGIRYIPLVIFSFALSDIFIGFHQTLLFTWGSVLIIGFLANYFNRNLISRVSGSFIGAVIFYLITNFGVWTSGYYGYSFNGLITSYFAAIPFFGYTIISTFIFGILIEFIYKFYRSINILGYK